MTRLPIPGQDDGTWGSILNDFLLQAHNSDGSLKNLGAAAYKDVGTTASTVAAGAHTHDGNATTLQLRRQTAAQWSAANPILKDGEVGVETDTYKEKHGNGTTAWNSLAYFGSEYALLADAVPLSSTAPSPLAKTAFAGTANAAARGDHVHPLPPVVGWYPLVPTNLGFAAVPLGRADTWNSIGNFTAPVVPFPVPRSMTLTKLKVNINTAADAGTFTMALYASNDRGLPTGAPVWVSPQTDATTTGAKEFASLQVSLPMGHYWLCFGSRGFTTTRSQLLAAAYDGRFAASLMSWGQDQESWTPTPIIANYNESTGAWPSSPQIDVMNDGCAFWYSINADPSA